MSSWLQHLPVFPILLPLVAGAAMLLLTDGQRSMRTVIALCATLGQLVVAIALLGIAGGLLPAMAPDTMTVYRLGSWSPPFGIVLVVDRLAAVMLTLTAVLAMASLVYSLARWDRMGIHFKPLFQFLLMGVNGAFLTGDLFNLFVFVEVLLAASYGLLLHGSGAPRVKSGLHYLAVNLAGSLLFLIGIALIYGIAGSLNMADLAMRLPTLTLGNRALFDTGAAILAVAFLLKAGAWPLNFWLADAYGAAAAPVAAMFSILTKVGIYALLRIGSLFSEAGAPPLLSGPLLFGIGLLTLFFGCGGMLGAQQPQRMAAYCVIVSTGTLLAVLGLGGAAIAGPVLFYLISSVLTTAAFFMLAEMIERSRAFGANVLAVSFDTFGIEDPFDPRMPDEVVGTVIPAAMAFLGLGFISCALLISGLPPLSGFIAKFSILTTALALTSDSSIDMMGVYLLLIAILGSGLVGAVALSRMGMRIFWSSDRRIVPRLRLSEAGPVAFLIAACLMLTIAAGPVAQYLDATGQSLAAPKIYIDAVLSVKEAPFSAGIQR
jgi:multicomponent K+:H+ antiporter subunit D